MEFFDINLFINNIFNGIPKPPCTFSIKFKDMPLQQRNKLLFKILVTGAKKIFGNQITIDNIDNHQFNILDKYIQSMGYKINYKISESNDYVIWFEKLNIIKNCNGTRVIEIEKNKK